MSFDYRVQYPAACPSKNIPPQLSGALQAFGSEWLNHKTVLGKRLRSLTYGRACFGRYRGAAIFVKPAHADFPRDQGRRGWIPSIISRHHFKKQSEVPNRPGHGADHTDQRKRSERGREVSSRWDSAGRWFQPANAGVMCGNANGAAAIAPHTARRKSCRDGGRFTTARPSRSAIQVPGIVGTTVKQIICFVGHQE